MPILGIIASSFRSGAGPVGAYDSLATVTLSASATSVTFAGIPSGYKHLEIRVFGKSTRTGSFYNDLYLTVNGVTSSVYSSHKLQGDGATATASGNSSATIMTIGSNVFPSAGRSGSGGGVITVLDYANTNKYKTVRSLIGADDNGSGYMSLTSGLWQSTNAITSLTFSTEVGYGDFAQYSSFALYGVK